VTLGTVFTEIKTFFLWFLSPTAIAEFITTAATHHWASIVFVDCVST